MVKFNEFDDLLNEREVIERDSERLLSLKFPEYVREKVQSALLSGWGSWLSYLETCRRVLSTYGSVIDSSWVGEEKVDRPPLGPSRLMLNQFRKTLRVKVSNLLQINPMPQIVALDSDIYAVKRAQATRRELMRLWRVLDLDRILVEIWQQLVFFGVVFVRVVRGGRLGIGGAGFQCIRCGADVLNVGVDVCPACGDPTFFAPKVSDGGGRDVKLEISSVFRIFIPWYCSSWEDVCRFGWIARFQILPIDYLREVYGRDIPSASVETFGEGSRWQVDILRYLRTVQPSAFDNAATVSASLSDVGVITEIWVSPTYTRRFIPHELPPSYERGAYLVFSGSELLDMRPARIEDEWVAFFYDRFPERFWANSEALDLLRLQDVLNELYSLFVLSAFYRGVGMIFANPQVVDINKVSSSPDVIHPVRVPPGVPVGSAIHVVQGSGVDSGVWNLFTSVLGMFHDLGLIYPTADVREVTGSPTAYAAAALRQQMIQSMRPLVVSFFDSFRKLCELLLEASYELWGDEPHVCHDDVYGDMLIVSKEDVLVPGRYRVLIEPNVLAPQGGFDRHEIVADALKNNIIDRKDPKNVIRIASLFQLEPFFEDYISERQRVDELIQKAIRGEYDEVPFDAVLDMHEVWISALGSFLRSERGRELRETRPHVYHALRQRLEAHIAAANSDLLGAAMAQSRALAWDSLGRAAEELGQKMNSLGFYRAMVMSVAGSPKVGMSTEPKPPESQVVEKSPVENG